MATLHIQDLIAYAQGQTNLTALVPATNIWLDIAGDNSLLPLLIFNQVSDVPEWPVAGNYASRLRIRITAYAATLAGVDAIVTQIYRSFDNVRTLISNVTFGCIRKNTMPMGRHAGAYSVMVEYLVFQDLVRYQ